MSVVGKLATCILNNAYVWLVNKLFKDDLISKKKKKGRGGEENTNIQSLKTQLF